MHGGEWNNEVFTKILDKAVYMKARDKMKLGKKKDEAEAGKKEAPDFLYPILKKLSL